MTDSPEKAPAPRTTAADPQPDQPQPAAPPRPWLCGDVTPTAPPSPPWLRQDYVALIVVFIITLGVYIATMAPSVTLEDSGELVTGAAAFGVPHPPGYPLWTICGWLIANLVPIGNLAWRINLESALFGALANGILAGTCSYVGRWLFAELGPLPAGLLHRICFFSGITAGLALGFSDVMWSQAVIAEVYTLNALFLVIILLCFSRWMMSPQYNGWLVASVFWYALGLTNHHTLLLIIPAFLIGCIIGNWRTFPSVLCGSIYYVGSALAVLAWFSEDPEMQQIAWRSMYLSFIFISLIAFWFTRRWSIPHLVAGAVLMGAILVGGSWYIGGWFEVNFNSTKVIVFLLAGVASAALVFNSFLNSRLIISLVVVGWIGLLPYAYMPFASATNPPMNWGYASNRTGFYRDITRGQYDGALDMMIKGILMKPLGIKPINPEEPKAISMSDPNGTVRLIAKVIYFYALQLEDGIQIVLAVSAFFVLLVVQDISLSRRFYLLFLFLSFFFGAFMISFIYPPTDFSYDLREQAKVFNLQSHSVYILFVGYGLISACIYLVWQEPRTPKYAFAGLMLLSLLPFQQNFMEHSQANHWFGYLFGYYGLKDTEKGSVIFGGTDAGRFVPTYMIFCESRQPERFKTVPGFDRSDLYIITQNSLADLNYIRYIRDQYDDRFKPKNFSALDKWLGRETLYPKESLTIMKDDEFADCRKEWEQTRGNLTDIPSMFHWNGILAKRIFEANKHKHTFYVEEMYNIPWMLDYLQPAGLFMKLSNEPLKEMPKEVVAADRKFWDAMTAVLLATPEYKQDGMAQRVFGKLRWCIGNVYYHRKMYDEAEYALAQSNILAPNSGEAVATYANFLIERGNYDKAETLLRRMRDRDPNSGYFQDRLRRIVDRKKTSEDIAKLEKVYAREPEDDNLKRQLMQLYVKIEDNQKVESMTRPVAEIKDLGQDEVVGLMEVYRNIGRMDLATRFLEFRQAKYPGDRNTTYNLAAMLAMQNSPDKAIEMLKEALKVDRDYTLREAAKDTRFSPLREDKRFIELIPSAAPSGTNSSTPPLPGVNAPVRPVPLNWPTNPAPFIPGAPKSEKEHRTLQSNESAFNSNFSFGP
ncbi:MAG: DUF2723 domain-containing protein [Candidatus Methylacidiphilales bacterium]|nr:DUF2723 domain-containing protein [Candidatus Methylacidiphilales bacterium]